MAALAALVARGGVAGAVVEGLIALAVVLGFGAVWIRERQGRRERHAPGEDFSDEE